MATTTKRIPIPSLLLASLIVWAAPSDAHAEEMASVTKPMDNSPYAFGMRVGGYGFRNPQATEVTDKWNDCRMNGVGVFGERMLNTHAFVETGADIYFADNFVLANNEAGEAQKMDRLSGLLTAAIGLKMAPTARIQAWAQLGLGVELTRVTLNPVGHSHDAETPPAMSAPEQQIYRAFPEGFVGVGASVRVTKKLHLGASFRTHLMAHFDHGPEVTELKAEPEAANQGQFFLKYDL